MTIYATNTGCVQDTYFVLRHLFDAARVDSNLSTRLWSLFSTFTDPERTVMTEYEHENGDRIKCQSLDYSDGEYQKHLYTFTPAMEIE